MTFRKRHSRKYRNKNTRRTKNRRIARRNTRKSHINRRGKNHYFGGGGLWTPSSWMPSLGNSKKDLTRKNVIQGIAEFIKNIQEIQTKHLTSCTKLGDLSLYRNINDYRDLDESPINNHSLASRVPDEDLSNWYKWRQSYKIKIGNAYSKYSSDIKSLIVLIKNNNKEFDLCIQQFQSSSNLKPSGAADDDATAGAAITPTLTSDPAITSLVDDDATAGAAITPTLTSDPAITSLVDAASLLDTAVLDPATRAHLVRSAATLNTTLTTLAAASGELQTKIYSLKDIISILETLLVNYNDKFDNQIETYLASGYINLEKRFHLNRLGSIRFDEIGESTDYKGLIEAHDKTKKQGEELIENLKTKSADITSALGRYCVSTNSLQQITIKYYVSINKDGIAAANALKEQLLRTYLSTYIGSI